MFRCKERQHWSGGSPGFSGPEGGLGITAWVLLTHICISKIFPA